MTAEPHWISKKALLLLHEESLAELGGMRGWRGRQIHAYKPESTIADLAASYSFGIAKNHAFVDGNKRAAFLSIGLFLAINGYRLKADQVDAIHTMLSVASGQLNEDGLAAWIARNAVLSEPSK